jgi:methionyl aminopeptidase
VIILRNEDEIQKIKDSAQIVKASLDAAEAAIEPGITTWDLNEIAEKKTIELGGKPAFKGYRGFPACLCTSVNNAIVHGIPRKDEVLKKGDIIGIDYGVNLGGYFGDSARTIAVGFEPEGRLKELIETTEKAFQLGVEAVRAGGFVQDIGRAIEDFVAPKGFGIVKDYVGHGIGTQPHEDPAIPHYDNGERGARLKAGMVICIEPMINMGSDGTKVLNDGWTVVTTDGQLSAHYEHTIAIREDGTEVLSA